MIWTEIIEFFMDTLEKLFDDFTKIQDSTIDSMFKISVVYTIFSLICGIFGIPVIASVGEAGVGTIFLTYLKYNKAFKGRSSDIDGEQ